MVWCRRRQVVLLLFVILVVSMKRKFILQCDALVKSSVFRRGVVRSSATFLSTLSMASTTTTGAETEIPSRSPIPSKSVQNQISSGGVAAAATVAAAAVNAAVSLKTLDAPDVVRSYVYRDGAAENRTGMVDDVGLPLVYDKDLIQSYWKKQGSALTQRWTEFLGYAVPFLTRVLTIVVSGGTPELKNQGATLAKDAREIFEQLGPTYIKLGQMMSVRPGTSTYLNILMHTYAYLCIILHSYTYSYILIHTHDPHNLISI